MDLVTRPPPTKGNAVILTIVDRFSKAAQFIVLSILPPALETATLFFDLVLQLHEIPADIVSDRGLQFTSQVWRGLRSLHQFVHWVSSTIGCFHSRYPWAINLHRGLLLLELVPSIQEFFQRTRETWKATRSALEHPQDTSYLKVPVCSAICHCQPALSYQPGQLVWLFTRNIPLATRSRKVTPASLVLSLLRTS